MAVVAAEPFPGELGWEPGAGAGGWDSQSVTNVSLLLSSGLN